MKTLKTFFEVNSEEISEAIFIFLLGSVISLVCVSFLVCSIQRGDVSSIAGMSAVLVSWGGGLFFVFGVELREMIANYKEEMKKRK